MSIILTLRRLIRHRLLDQCNNPSVTGRPLQRGRVYLVYETPDIYPIELLYISMEKCLEEFEDLLETIIGNVR